MGEFVGLLSFDDDFTLFKQLYFIDCFVGIYPILSKSLMKPMTWIVAIVRVKNIQEVRKIALDNKWRQEVYCSQSDNLTEVVDGDSTLFPRCRSREDIDWKLRMF